MVNGKKIPYHLGIILDGNRRWAEARNLSIGEGHKKGAETVKNVINWCRDRGVKILTLFAFSTENWKRPKNEVNFLMDLGKKVLDKDFKKLTEQGIKFRMIGERKSLPKAVVLSIEKLEDITKNNNKMTFNLALSYGGRAEIVDAIKKIVEKKIPPEKITEEVIKENLWTSDVDLIIRTGKVQRLSNFLIWQAAYSELYFSNKYWPDFSEKDLDEAFADYALCQRKFGK